MIGLDVTRSAVGPFTFAREAERKDRDYEVGTGLRLNERHEGVIDDLLVVISASLAFVVSFEPDPTLSRTTRSRLAILVCARFRHGDDDSELGRGAGASARDGRVRCCRRHKPDSSSSSSFS